VSPFPLTPKLLLRDREALGPTPPEPLTTRLEDDNVEVVVVEVLLLAMEELFSIPDSDVEIPSPCETDEGSGAA